MTMRLADIVGAISIAADLSSGLPAEKGLRTVIAATRLADRVGAPRADVFWVSALRFVGCTAFAPEAARFSAGNDNGMRRTMVYVDFDKPFDALKRIVTGLGAGATLRERATGVARFVLDRDISRRYAASHCESAMFFARTLGMGDEIARALATTGERFDGKGVRGLAGDELPLAARISDVADVVELFAWTGGLELARRVLGERRGSTLDPQIVDAALATLPELVDDESGAAWDTYLACEPEPRRAATDDLDRACAALGLFGDVKSVFTLAHSGRVAALAEAAGRAVGLDDATCALLRRAGAVHDIGRVAVANATWDKRGTLSAAEWQRVRSHSHHTDTVLRTATLGELADVAGAVHERGRGTGYHRGISLDRISLLSRIIAAADVAAALGEDRPHRPAHAAPAQERELRDLVAGGALDDRAVRAVLDGRGGTPPRRPTRPSGLSEREVEVVRLVAIGRTNKEIGVLLGMSPRTAQRHVMNVYSKVGLESRAGLALYAVEHGLLES
jgi:HD-GYP domain-containing protein (c-di-GMP phosphodiesterase class II)